MIHSENKPLKTFPFDPWNVLNAHTVFFIDALLFVKETLCHEGIPII